MCMCVFLLCVSQNCDRMNDLMQQQQQQSRSLSYNQQVPDTVHRHHASEDDNVSARNCSSLRRQEFSDESNSVTYPSVETASDVAPKHEESEENDDSSPLTIRCHSEPSKHGNRRGKRRKKSDAAAKANSDLSQDATSFDMQTSSPKLKPLRLKMRKSKHAKIVEKCEPDDGAECSGSEKQPGESDDTVCTCEECGKEFPNANKLAKHRRTHSSRVFHCSECSTDFVEAVTFKRHSVLVHGIHRPFTCSHDGCNYSSDRLSNVEKHMSIHSPTHAFACSLCGRTFAQDAGLRSHLLSCMSSRSFLCDLCGSSFNHLQSMQSHQRIHTGERPYRCTDCDSTFADHRNYKRHRRIHDNAFPYECMLCGKRFRHSNSLKSHLGSHGILTKPVSVEGAVTASTSSSRVDFPAGIFSKPVQSAAVTPTHSTHTLAHAAF